MDRGEAARQCVRSRRAISALASSRTAASVSTRGRDRRRPWPAPPLPPRGRPGRRRCRAPSPSRYAPSAAATRRRAAAGCAAAASRPAGRTAPAPRVRGCARRASCATDAAGRSPARPKRAGDWLDGGSMTLACVGHAIPPPEAVEPLWPAFGRSSDQHRVKPGRNVAAGPARSRLAAGWLSPALATPRQMSAARRRVAVEPLAHAVNRH